MNPPRILVVFYSAYGTNQRMAAIASEAASDAGADVRLRKVPETAPPSVVRHQKVWSDQVERAEIVPTVGPDDMEWADGFLFSAPTRCGGVASPMRTFIDSLRPLWTAGKLANKTATAMTSAENAHGGQETTLLTQYITFMHWGCILVPNGYTDQSVYDSGGNPYGVSVTSNDGAPSDAEETAIRHQARRLVEVTARLKSSERNRAYTARRELA